MAKPSYKKLFHILAYFGLIFSNSTCKLTLRYFFPTKSNQCITNLFILSLALSWAAFWVNINLQLEVVKLDRGFTETWRKSNMTFADSIVHEAGFISTQLYGILIVLLSMSQAWTQDIGMLMERIRKTASFESRIPDTRCLILAGFIIMTSTLDSIYGIWRTGMLMGAVEATGFYGGSIQFCGWKIRVSHFKWIRNGYGFSKHMLVMYRQLHLTLSAHYAAQLISNFGETIFSSKFKKRYGADSIAILDEWKNLTGVFESINRAHGLYLLIFFPAAILITIISICAQFIETSPVRFGIGTRIMFLVPGIWIICRMLIFMELGHTLERAIRRNRIELQHQMYRYSDHGNSFGYLFPNSPFRPGTQMFLEWKWKLSAAGFFCVNRKMLTTITATTLTYLIVMFQLYVTDEK